MHWFEGHYWGMHLFWWIIWIILFIWIFITPWDIPGQRTKKDTPLEILKRRYARGEIDRQQFEDMKKDLQS